jgi:hypothetical protein
VWEPDPQWRRLGGGRGPLDVGVWATERDGRGWVVKRVRAPGPDDPAELTDPTHPSYWHREADLALDFRPARGLVAPEVVRVDEDAAGYVLWTERVERGLVTGLFAARALGRFAAEPLPPAPWWSQALLHRRLAATEARGGWETLRRTPVADLADALWRARPEVLARYDALPQLGSHGDPVPGNLVAPRGEDVVAVDWGSAGLAPAGADLGYYALSCKEDFGVLLDAHLDGLGPGHDRAAVAFAARAMLVYTVLGRADWALARAASGPGPLEATYRHPSVAPHLRALQRRLPEIEALLADAADRGVSGRPGGRTR